MKRVHVWHLRGVHCHRGVRALAIDLGLDWRRFVSEGYPIDELRKVPDARVQAMCDKVEAEDGQ